MTCIVGVINKKEGYVSIGADSAGVSGLNITIRKDSKVFKVSDFVIGCTSSFRMIQLLMFNLKLPEIGEKDIFEYMCTDFVNSVRTTFKEGGFLTTTSGVEEGGTFLVAYKDRLFEIESDFQVCESINDYASCGCGKYYALGALYSSNIGNTDKKILIALEAASYFSGGVEPPFKILSTKN